MPVSRYKDDAAGRAVEQIASQVLTDGTQQQVMAIGDGRNTSVDFIVRTRASVPTLTDPGLVVRQVGSNTIAGSNGVVGRVTDLGGFTPAGASNNATARSSAAGQAAAASLTTSGGLRICVARICVERYATAALSGAAGPVEVTISGTFGGPHIIGFSSVGDAGSLAVRDVDWGSSALIASAVNGSVTVTAPATPNVIWRVSVFGYNV